MIKLLKTAPLLLPLFLFACSSPHIIEKESPAVATTTEQSAEKSVQSADKTPLAIVRKQVNSENIANKSCDAGPVTLTADFSAGRMDECKRVAENEFEIV